MTMGSDGQQNLSTPFDECGIEGRVTSYDYNARKWKSDDLEDSTPLFQFPHLKLSTLYLRSNPVSHIMKMQYSNGPASPIPSTGNSQNIIMVKDERRLQGIVRMGSYKIDKRSQYCYDATYRFKLVYYTY